MESSSETLPYQARIPTNILVVDDLAANRKLLRAQLEAEGISVVEAADGVEALEVLAREPLDAVISDILMPRMDGYRLCHEVRKNPALRKLRFVLYSSTYTSPADVRLSKTIGADQFVAKPAPIAAIMEALQISVERGAQHSLVLPDDAFILKRYSEVLVAKLEDKNAELEKALEASQRSHNRIQELNSHLVETIGELEAFSYSVSHDMRAPLRAMQGFAQLLLMNNQASLDAQSIDYLSRIKSSAARLDGLINDVLTYSRLLRSEIVLAPVNLDELVRQVIDSYPQLQEKGVEIVIENFLPAVLANEASLTQCVSNLLSNAVKFVAAGSPARVRIHADRIEGDVRLWIEDNGIGIDPVNHDRIWNIFTRVERAKDYEGTGIGLAIVRKAVERMNGQVGVESAHGQGSKFWLRLRGASA